MSNSLNRIIRALRTDLFSPRHAALFEAARGRHTILAGHHTIASVLAVLRDERSCCYPERESLTRALIFEQQHTPSPFWSSALLTAYYPMLCRIRYGIFGGDTLSCADLDQIVLSSFLFTVASFSLDDKQDRIAMWLRQQTRQSVRRAVRDIRCHRESLCLNGFDDLDFPADAVWPETWETFPPGPRNAVDAAEAVSALLSFAGDKIDGECFDLMTARFICQKRISAYIQKMLPGLSNAKRRILYQRIKRRHSRALALIRPRLREVRPVKSPDFTKVLCLLRRK